MANTVSTAAQEFYSVFYYTAAAKDNCTASAIEQLALGQVHNAASNGTIKNLPEGKPVLNIANHNGTYVAQVGVATGVVLDVAPSTIWPCWSNDNSVVHGVIWVSKMVQVPNSYFAKNGGGKRMNCVDYAAVAVYVHQHG